MADRYEDYGMSYDVYTPTDHRRMEDTVRFRTYTAEQFTTLIDQVDGLDIVGIHDFSYDIRDKARLLSAIFITRELAVDKAELFSNNAQVSPQTETESAYVALTTSTFAGVRQEIRTDEQHTSLAENFNSFCVV